MTENIVINFEAKADQLLSMIDALKKLDNVSDSQIAKFKELNKATSTVDKQLEGIAQTLNIIALSGQKTSSILENTAKKVKGVGVESKNTGISLDDLSKKLTNIAGAVGIAFGVSQIIAFGKESVKAYAASEKAQIQLLAALNKQEGIQKRLLGQADELQDKFGIDNDVIVQQQAFLALQGRTEEQISKTIDAAIQLSAVTGEDLPSAVVKLDQTYEGSIGRLGKLDKRFEGLTKTQLANGAAIDLVNEKYKGFAEAGAEGLSGQLEIQQRRIDDIVKTIGQRLGPAWLTLKEIAVSAILGITDALVTIGILQDKTPLEKFQARYNTTFARVKKANIDAKTSTEDLTKSIKEQQSVLSSKKGDQQIDVIATIAAYQSILKDRTEAANNASQKQVDTLESLKDQLDDLKKRQLKIEDPLGAGKIAAATNLREQQEIQKKIDEITGEAAKKRAEEAIKLKEAENQRLAKLEAQALQGEKDAEEIRLNELELAKEKELGIVGTTEKRKLEIILASIQKELEAKRKANDLIAVSKLAVEEQKVRNQITDLGNKENLDLWKTFQNTLGLIKKQDTKKTLEDEEKKQEAIKRTLELIGEYSQIAGGIFKNFSEGRIQDLEAQKEAANEQADAETQALEEQFGKRRLSKKKYEDELSKIEKKKQDEQKKIDAAVRAERRKQAEIDRALALFNIAINIPEMITKLGAQLGIGAAVAIPLAIALGAIQAAAVLSAPLPKFHKGRLAKTDGAEELAVIRKDETIFPPDQSRQFAPTFSAIYNRKIKPIALNELVANHLNGTFSQRVDASFDSMKLAYDIAYVLRDQKVVIKNVEDFSKALSQPKPFQRW